MSGRLFLVHWNEVEAGQMASPLRAAGWEVDVEAADGGAAYKRTGERVPDLLVVCLDRLPSHGVPTARHIRQRKKTAGLPIVFVGGTTEAVERARGEVSDAEFVGRGEMEAAVERYRGEAA